MIIQGLNWPSTLKPLLNLGLTPVLCDVDMDSLNASVATVSAVRTERTRMVIAVPVLGNPAHLDALHDWCESEGLLLFEDSCESIGAVTESGRRVGTIGTAAAYSFYFSHHMSTIEGGAVLTDSDELADMINALRAHGWSRNLKLEGFLDFDSGEIDPRFCFVLPGYNVRSTDLNAALGRVQLARLDNSIAARRRIAKGRIAALAGHPSGTHIPGAALAERHSWMTTPILFASRDQRLAGQAILEDLGIETRPIIVGNILRHPLARMLGEASKGRELPVCDQVFDRGLMIGLNPDASDEDESFVHDALIKAANG